MICLKSHSFNYLRSTSDVKTYQLNSSTIHDSKLGVYDGIIDRSTQGLSLINFREKQGNTQG